ncbi:choice-of-anchor Q domain-containing protein [Gimesia fumaroli]|nr:choice-of-anchor Q domain-containing protein [Gimesia fumaroli]
MFASLWLPSLKHQLRSRFSRSTRARRNRHQLPSAQTLVARNAAETLEDRTLLTAFTVVNTNDSGAGSLRDAIEQANANAGADTISFDAALAGETFLFSEQLKILDELSIVGLGADQMTFQVDGGSDDNFSLIFIEDYDSENIYSVDISGISFDGVGKGRAIYSMKNLTVTDCQFTNLSARKNGGAIFAKRYLTVRNSSFSNNETEYSGGAIYHSIAYVDFMPDYHFIVSDSYFYKNIAGSSGGGICTNSATQEVLDGYSGLQLSSSTFIQNESSSSGGGVSVLNGWMDISDSKFISNKSVRGGGLSQQLSNSYRNTDTASKVSNCDFIENSASYGGGGFYQATWSEAIYELDGNERELTVAGCDFRANTAVERGGGMCLTSGNIGVTILDTVVSGNSSEIDGGGIFTATKNIFVDRCLIDNNYAIEAGGGTYSLQHLLITNSTVSKNTTDKLGGGVYASGYFTLSASTVVLNSAGERGGGFYENNPSTYYSTGGTNSIIAGNVAAYSGAQTDGSSQWNNCIIQDSTDGLLDPVLRDNGGSTKTHALLFNSAAINAGNNGAAEYLELITDQRGAGFSRFVDETVDIGAFESESLHLLVDSATDTDDGDYSVGNLSLREAIKLSNESATTDTITFDASLFDQTLMLFNELVITDDVTIIGHGAEHLTLSGDGTRRLFRIDDGDEETSISVELSGFTLTNGFANYTSGGAIHSLETLSISDVVFADNQASVFSGSIHGGSYGGAIYSAGDLTVTNSTFIRNSADWSGGAIYSTEGLLSITGCDFTENQTSYSGGAILVQDGDLTVSSSTFTENSSDTLGGGIYITQGVLTVSESVFTENSSSAGGAIYHQISSTFPPVLTELNITDSTFQGNTATSSGGAVYYSSALSVYSSYYTAYIENCLFSENSANSSYGGALFSGGENVLVSGSTFFKNTAGNRGGGISDYSRNLTVQNSLFEKNSTNRYGGALYVEQTLILINSTLSANTSLEIGGGIAFGNSASSFEIVNSTLTGNAAARTGGGIYALGSIPGTITNSIIAGNSAPSISQVSLSFSRNNSIVQDSIEGLLDPVLRDNGGLTKTHALLPGSAGIDAGDDEALENVNSSILNRRETTHDSRGAGYERYRGEAIDIGAFEVQRPFAQIEMTLVDSPTSTAGNGEVAALPESLDWVDEWSGYWLEIWVSAPSAADLGVLSVALDLSYNTAITTAVAIEYGAAFTLNQTGAIDDTSGLIASLSAETNLTDVGDDQHVLFARIRFESTSEDGIDLDLEGEILIPQSPEFVINNLGIVFADNTDSEEVHGSAPATQVWANPFDLDDNDAINIRDLILFINQYSTIPSESNSPYAWFTDYNQDDRINSRDLISLINNYGKQKSNQTSISYPRNFPTAWKKHLTVEPALLPQQNANSVDQTDAESVLDGVVEYLEPQLTSEENNKLAQVNIEVIDLVDGVLSNTVRGTIYVDVNAAGYGWFVDDTPGDNSEFYLSGFLSLTTFPFSDAVGKIDLWTVILHELGHLLGYEHEADGVMQDTLAPGVRKLSDWADDETDSFFSTIGEDSGLVLF